MGRVSGFALARAFALAALVLAPIGCKKEEPAVKMHSPPPMPGQVQDSVAGHVRYHDVGLASGYVEIFGENGEKKDGAIQMGGTYTVWNPPHGKVKITVRTKPPNDVSTAPPAKHAGNNIPSRYQDPDTSGLTFEVVGGKQTFEIILSD
jgi:hypothetical protein